MDQRSQNQVERGLCIHAFRPATGLKQGQGDQKAILNWQNMCRCLLNLWGICTATEITNSWKSSRAATDNRDCVRKKSPWIFSHRTELIALFTYEKSMQNFTINITWRQNAKSLWIKRGNAQEYQRCRPIWPHPALCVSDSVTSKGRKELADTEEGH